MSDYEDIFRRHIVCLEDGMYYFDTYLMNCEAFTSQDLRKIADYLDEKNKDVDESILMKKVKIG